MRLITALFLLGLTVPALAVEQISPESLAEKAADDAAPVIIDVRSEEEYLDGHVPGALLMPHDQIDQHQDTLASLAGEEVVVYCASNRRAGLILDDLREAGITDIRFLEGAYPGWEARGEPVYQAAR